MQINGGTHNNNPLSNRWSDRNYRYVRLLTTWPSGNWKSSLQTMYRNFRCGFVATPTESRYTHKAYLQKICSVLFVSCKTYVPHEHPVHCAVRRATIIAIKVGRQSQSIMLTLQTTSAQHMNSCGSSSHRTAVLQYLLYALCVVTFFRTAGSAGVPGAACRVCVHQTVDVAVTGC